MDSKLVNEKALGYADRTVRINPTVMKQLGLEKQGINLKIDEYLISCIPFDLSLSKASVLAFLSAKEVQFFEGMKARPQALNLVCRTPGTTKPAAFFVRCAVLSFRKPDPDSPYCFIDLRFNGEIPFLLKELLVTYFLENDEAELFWNQSGDEGLARETIDLVFPQPHVELLKDGVTAERLRVVYLSPRKIRLFGEFEGAAPEKGELLDFEARDDEGSCLIRGACTEFAAFEEAPGFAFLSLEPQFTPCLAARMKRVTAAKAGRSKPG